MRAPFFLIGIMLASSGVVGVAPQDGAPTAEAIVQRAVDAHGGIAAWHRFQDVAWRETVKRFEKGRPLETTVRRIFIKKQGGTLLLRLEQDGGGVEHLDEHLDVENARIDGHLVIGFDGRQSWYSVDGVLDTSARAARSARYVTAAFAYWFGLPFKLLDAGVHLKRLAPEVKYGERHERVEVSFGSSVGDNPTDGFVYYFAPDSGRIKDLVFWRLGRRDRPRLAQWRDYVKVGDLWKESLRIFANATTQEKGSERGFEYLRVNAGLPDRLFGPESRGESTQLP